MNRNADNEATFVHLTKGYAAGIRHEQCLYQDERCAKLKEKQQPHPQRFLHLRYPPYRYVFLFDVMVDCHGTWYDRRPIFSPLRVC